MVLLLCAFFQLEQAHSSAMYVHDSLFSVGGPFLQVLFISLLILVYL